MIDKSEKYLKSIDNTLGEILKELKRQARLRETTSLTIDAKASTEILQTIKDLELKRSVNESLQNLT
jgi:hypothetical protein